MKDPYIKTTFNPPLPALKFVVCPQMHGSCISLDILLLLSLELDLFRALERGGGEKASHFLPFAAKRFASCIAPATYFATLIAA